MKKLLQKQSTFVPCGEGDPRVLWLIPHKWSELIRANYFPNLQKLTPGLLPTVRAPHQWNCKVENVTSQDSRGELVSHHRHTPRSLERSAPAKHSVVELRVPAPCPPARSQSRCSRGFCISIDFCSWWARARYATHSGGKFRPGSLERTRDQRTPEKVPAENSHSSPRTALTALARPRRRAREPSVRRLPHALGGPRSDGATGLRPVSGGGRRAGGDERLLSSVRSDAPGVPGNFASPGGGWRWRGGPVPPGSVPLQVPTGERPQPASLGSAPQRAWAAPGSLLQKLG